MNDNLLEFGIFLFCLWCGTLLGAVYDLFRLIRAFGKKWLSVFADVLFGAVFFIIAAYAMYYSSNGVIHLYGLAAIVIGAVIYQALPGKMIRSALFAVIGLFSNTRHKNKSANK